MKLRPWLLSAVLVWSLLPAWHAVADPQPVVQQVRSASPAGNDEKPPLVKEKDGDVVSSCRLRGLKDGVYRGAAISVWNRSDERKTCSFRCSVVLSYGTQDFSCTETLEPKESRTVCQIYRNQNRFIDVESVSDSPPC